MTISRRSFFAPAILLAAGSAAFRPSSANADTVQYQYDVFGRVVRVIYNSGATIDYTYDAAGNRTQIVRSSSPPANSFTQTISVSGGGGVNLRTLANGAGYNGAQPATVTYQLGSGATVTGASGGGIGIDTGTWPYTEFAVLLTLEIAGTVIGGGGWGGIGGDFVINATPGGAGGDAIHCRLPATVVVQSGGVVSAGGGGGGGAGALRRVFGGEPTTWNAGGGGGGYPNGTGGIDGSGADFNVANPGSNGTTSGGGAGGSGGATGHGTRTTGTGGAGGGVASSGASGGNPTGSGGTGTWTAGAPGAGGAAGYAIRKNGFTVSVTNNGTINGTQG